MGSVTYYKKGSRLPVYERQLLDDLGQPYSLAGIVSLTFYLKARGQADNVAPKVNGAAATIVDAATGTVRYAWGATDLDTVGRFRVEWHANFGGGLLLKFPAPGYDEVVVEEDLAA